MAIGAPDQTAGIITGTSVTSIDVSFASLPTVGDTCVVFAAVAKAGGGTTLTCADNQGNTYTQTTTPELASNNRAYVFNGPIATSSGTFTVTITAALTGSNIAGFIAEWASLDDGTLSDAGASATESNNPDANPADGSLGAAGGGLGGDGGSGVVIVRFPTQTRSYQALGSFASDAAAELGGVLLGEFYRDSSSGAVRQRLT